MADWIRRRAWRTTVLAAALLVPCLVGLSVLPDLGALHGERSGGPRLVEVRLVDTNGAPLFLGMVSVHLDGQQDPTWAVSPWALGSVSLWVPDAPFSLVGTAEGYRSERQSFRDASGPRSPIVLRLARWRGGRGRVLQEGVPVPDARVFLFIEEEDRTRRGPGPARAEAGHADMPRIQRRTVGRAETDAQGRFQIHGNADTLGGFRVELDGVVVAEFPARPIPAGGPPLEQDLEIGALATLEGSVRTNGLLPVVSVILAGPEKRIYRAPVDEQGHYRIARMATGPYVVRVAHSRGADIAGALFEPSRVDLVAHPGESLSHDIDLRGDLLFVADQGGGGCDGPAFRERVLRRAGDEYRAEDLTIPVGRVEELRRAILEARSVPSDNGEQRPLDPSILLQTTGMPAAEWEAALRAREAPSVPGSFRPYTRTVVLPEDPEIRILATFWLSSNSKLDPGLGPVPLFLLWFGAEARQSLDPALGSALQAFFPRGGTVSSSSFAGATLR